MWERIRMNAPDQYSFARRTWWYIGLGYLSLLTLLSCQSRQINHIGQLKYSIVRDLQADTSGNVYVVKNFSQGCTPLWDWGFGSSNKATDTIRFAFAGEYTIELSAITATDTIGPVSEKVKINKNALHLLVDPLWDSFTGGYGNQKSWVLDMDGCYFNAPLYFAGTDKGWVNTDGSDCYGPECWYWIPNFKEHPWLMEHTDHGTMTFSLREQPCISVSNADGSVSHSGTFMIDTTKKTLTTYGAAILHTLNWEFFVSNWFQSKIISVSDEHLQLAVLRDQNSSDKNILLVFNYISTEYALACHRPSSKGLAHTTRQCANSRESMIDILAGKHGNSKTWKLDQQWPIDWTDSLGRGWTTNYRSAWNWAWDQQSIDDTKDLEITFSNHMGNLYFKRLQHGNSCSSSVAVDTGKGELSIADCDLLSLTNSWLPTSGTNIKWIKDYWKDGAQQGIWLGIETKNNEYVAYHFVPKK